MGWENAVFTPAIIREFILRCQIWGAPWARVRAQDKSVASRKKLRKKPILFSGRTGRIRAGRVALGGKWRLTPVGCGIWRNAPLDFF